LRKYWVNCPEYVFPGDHSSYALIFRPIGMGAVTITARGNMCNPNLTSIVIYHIRHIHASNHLTAVKYVYSNPPTNEKPIQWMFKQYIGSLPYIMIVLMRRARKPLNANACSMHVIITFKIP